jgi:hypothetical protein
MKSNLQSNVQVEAAEELSERNQQL